MRLRGALVRVGVVGGVTRHVILTRYFSQVEKYLSELSRLAVLEEELLVTGGG